MASPIDPTSDRPKFKQLGDILRAKIVSGEWEPGSELPSKQQLADQYGVSINTVEGALRELKIAGLIVMERGRLSRVLPQAVNVMTRYELGKKGYRPDVESAFAREHGVPWSVFSPELQRRYETIPAPERVAALLRCVPGEPVVERTWLHRIDGVPIRLAKSYLTVAEFGDTILCDPDVPPNPGGTIGQLKEIGVDVWRDDLLISWREATEEEQAIFNSRVDKGVLVQWRVHLKRHISTTTPRGIPVETACHVWPAPEKELAFSVPLEEFWYPQEA